MQYIQSRTSLDNKVGLVYLPATMNTPNTDTPTTESSATSLTTANAASTVGRNEPCPCKSGKKYKRCHGVDAAPKLSTPKVPAGMDGETGMGASGAANPFDPSQMDPAAMSHMAKAMQRLPRGQLQRIQSIMKRAMAGQDVTKEAAELEKMLPPEFKAMASAAMGASGLANMAAAEASPPDLSFDEAKKLVAKAVSEGKLSEEEAAGLLATQAPAGGTDATTSDKPSLWKKLFKK